MVSPLAAQVGTGAACLPSSVRAQTDRCAGGGGRRVATQIGRHPSCNSTDIPWPHCSYQALTMPSFPRCAQPLCTLVRSPMQAVWCWCTGSLGFSPTQVHRCTPPMVPVRALLHACQQCMRCVQHTAFPTAGSIQNGFETVGCGGEGDAFIVEKPPETPVGTTTAMLGGWAGTTLATFNGNASSNTDANGWNVGGIVSNSIFNGA